MMVVLRTVVTVHSTVHSTAHTGHNLGAEILLTRPNYHPPTTGTRGVNNITATTTSLVPITSTSHYKVSVLQEI